jgi:hypothetical protein
MTPSSSRAPFESHSSTRRRERLCRGRLREGLRYARPGPVAQWSEQRTHNPSRPGSNPGGPNLIRCGRKTEGALRPPQQTLQLSPTVMTARRERPRRRARRLLDRERTSGCLEIVSPPWDNLLGEHGRGSTAGTGRASRKRKGRVGCGDGSALQSRPSCLSLGGAGRCG